MFIITDLLSIAMQKKYCSSELYKKLSQKWRKNLAKLIIAEILVFWNFTRMTKILNMIKRQYKLKILTGEFSKIFSTYYMIRSVILKIPLMFTILIFFYILQAKILNKYSKA